ncbi:MAG: penicillin-binding protein 2 [Actinomycetota bacterium]
MLVMLTLALSLVAGRLVQLQVVQAQPLQMLGEEQRLRTIDLPARRGAIYDRNMTPLAVSVETRAVYAHPRAITDPVVAARLLAPVLGIAESDLVQRLGVDVNFTYLARRVSPAVVDKVTALDLPYVGSHPESLRAYPAGSVASQLIGFVGTDGEGLGGLEFKYERTLGGTPGQEIIEQDPRGRPIPQGRSRVRTSTPGKGLALTIDRDLQFFAEDALARGVRENGARNGVAIVMDPRSGDVLAMANYPPFEAERLSDSTPDERRNRAVTDAYEPGSVNKVVTAAAAIEAGIVTPEDQLTVPSTIRVANQVFHDSHSHPVERITYAQAIAESSNVGTIKVALKLGPKRLYDALTRFGLGSSAQVGFPGESSGVLLPVGDWSGTSIATIPIGQGIAATPLQVASVYATLANDGVRVRPRLVRGVVESDGSVTPVPAARAVRVVQPYTAAQVRGMLVGVVEHGTGSRARIPGYLVGGKTGTARVPLKDRRGYSRNIVTTFAGLAPADDPRIVVLVAMDNPRTRFAALTAAPVFREITQFALGKLGISPTIAIHDGAEFGLRWSRKP